MSNNLDVVRGAYEAFAKGDVAGVLGALSSEVDWTEMDGGPCGGGRYSDPDTIAKEVFAKLVELWEDFRSDPTEFIDGGDAVVVLGQYSGKYRATAKIVRAEFVHVWNLKDGKVVRFREHTDTYKILTVMK